MSDENFLIDGKIPLQSLRVVDLREELKKRGIRTTGTKSQLQALLISAIQSNSSSTVDNVVSESVEENIASNENESITTDSANNEIINNSSDQKVASISINEEKETIKLTIRSSPRKSEPSQIERSESESEASPEGTTGSEDSLNEIKQSIVLPIKDDTTQDSVNTEEESINESKANDVGQEELNDSTVAEKDTSNEITYDKITDSTHEFSHEDICDSTNEISFDKSNQLNNSLENNSNISKAIVGNTIAIPENIESNIENINSNQLQDSKIKPIRGRLLSQSKSVNEDSQKPIQKKRRWGSTKDSDSSVLKKGISSDKLKQLINDSVVETIAVPTKVSKSDSTNEEEPVLAENITEEDEDTKKDGIFVNADDSLNIKTNTDVENVVPDEKENTRSISPAKNPTSTVLFITGLVRPYTLMQLKKLLSLTGTIDEEKFWIDKIKSKCYVAYSSTDEAIKTRESLHNLKWPQSSPKNLSVEFATFEDIDRCLNPENYEDLPAKSAHANEKTLPNIEMAKGKFDIILNDAIRDSKEQENIDKEPNIREWDRNKVNRLNDRTESKEDDGRKRARNSSPSRKEHSRERSKSPAKINRNDDRHKREITKRSESPVKLLEDLFRKTKGTPYIYWLPLTDEQIVEKEKLRVKLEKEREERITARREMVVRNDSPIHRPPPMNRNQVRDRPKVQDYNRRRSPSPPQYRRKRSASPSPPRNFGRYSRSRSPDRRRNRISPRRRR